MMPEEYADPLKMSNPTLRLQHIQRIDVDDPLNVFG